MIKSVKFKDPNVSYLKVGERIIRPENLTPELFRSLLELNPRFSEQFDVILSEDKEVETVKEETNDESGTGKVRSTSSKPAGSGKKN
jgi:hypothetical protein